MSDDSVNSREMVEIWYDMIVNDKEYRKKYGCKGKRRYPKFTREEAIFLTRIVFRKDYKNLIYEISGFLYEQGTILCAKDRRRLKFLHAFLEYGNATKAAVIAGYSPNTAKQQGYRVLKNIGNYTLMSKPDEK